MKKGERKIVVALKEVSVKSLPFKIVVLIRICRILRFRTPLKVGMDVITFIKIQVVDSCLVRLRWLQKNFSDKNMHAPGFTTHSDTTIVVVSGS